jgi:AcrR family transcriptional regulator
LASERRRQRHAGTEEEIKTLARRQMGEQGTASLSLRTIAREMGVTPPALYRYFASRDDLITALILDAYDDLADTMEATRDAAPAETDLVARLFAACMEYRAWALVHPVDYQLIFGNPIPGYSAPSEATQPAARRTLSVFVGMTAEALQRGALALPAAYEVLPGELEERLGGILAGEGYEIPAGALAYVLAVWARMQGLITLELFGHLQPILGDPDVFYRFEIASVLQRADGHPADA